jgi:hypothetical protein
MPTASDQYDLIVLVPDIDIEYTIGGLLKKPERLGIRPIKSEILRHRYHDSGCYKRGDDFLAPFRDQYVHALIVFDHDGCGAEDLPREEVEADLEERLYRRGWTRDAVAVIAIDPEVEQWVWGGSPHVEKILGWSGRSPALREWIRENFDCVLGETKPKDPKEAMRQALRIANKRQSASQFEELASKVSLKKCTDPAFLKLKQTLHNWFPPTR